MSQPYSPQPDPAQSRPWPQPSSSPQPQPLYPQPPFASSPLTPSPYGGREQPAMGQLVLDLRKPFGLMSASMISPKLTIDGYPAPVRWGPNAFPAPAGPRVLQVSSSYMWDFGKAEMVVDLPPGESRTVHYTGPFWTFQRGRMGSEVQPRPGLVAFLILLAVPILLLLLIVFALLVARS